MANKKQTLKVYNKFTQAIQAKTPKQQVVADTFKRTEKYPRDCDVATNITERVIKLITLDNQLISMVEDQGFLYHLEFLNPRCALPSLHYITLTPLSSYNVPVCSLGSWVSYSRACKTGNRGDAEHV